jgi:putative tryptophan/tyrosine transport system substrate-binding protein
MTKKVISFALGTMLFALSLPVEAQQTKKIPRIGFLTSATSLDRTNPNLEAFRYGLRNLGWVEGQTILIEYRWAEGKNERLRDLAAELVHIKVDLIVATGGTATNAAKQATKTIPIVFMQVGNPEQQGFVESFARPGGNITGLSNIAEEVSGKRLELLKETFPKVSRVAVLWDLSTGTHSLNVTEETARLLAVQLQILEVREVKDFDVAFRAATKGRAEALTVLSSGIFQKNPRRPGYKEPIAGGFRSQKLCGGRRAYFLWSGRSGDVSPRRRLRRQNLERHQASGSSCRTANEV